MPNGFFPSAGSPRVPAESDSRTPPQRRYPSRRILPCRSVNPVHKPSTCGDFRILCNGATRIHRVRTPCSPGRCYPRRCGSSADAFPDRGEEAVVRIITVPGGFEDFMRERHEAEGDAWDTVAARYWIRMLPTA